MAKKLFLKSDGKAARFELGFFALAMALALIGFLVSGCDGGGAAPSDSVDGSKIDVSRPVSCDIPSPTGDQPSGYGKARDLPAQNHVLVSNDVRSACESWKASYPTSYAARPTGPEPSVVAGVDCSDPAHDFQGSTGRPWSVVAQGSAGQACQATSLEGSCAAAGLAEMPKYQSSDPQKRLYVRSWALCTSSLVFEGWMYTVS